MSRRVLPGRRRRGNSLLQEGWAEQISDGFGQFWTHGELSSFHGSPGGKSGGGRNGGGRSAGGRTRGRTSRGGSRTRGNRIGGCRIGGWEIGGRRSGGPYSVWRAMS